MRTRHGGLLNLHRLFTDPSLPPSSCMTSKPSQMQVRASGLPSPSKADGELGVSSQDGRLWMEKGTLDGQKQSASSSWSRPSPGLDTLADTLKYTGITKELSTPGRILGVENKATNRVFRRIHSFLNQFSHSLSILAEYVPSESNPADPPSRGLYPSSWLLLPEIGLTADLDRFIVDATVPYTPTKNQVLPRRPLPSCPCRPHCKVSQRRCFP